MPRGSELNEMQKQRIMDLRNCGNSQRQIASMINKSQSVVKHFLKLGIENYGQQKRTGRPSRYSATVKRAVLRQISKTGASSSKIVEQFNLKCDSSLVRKWIAKSEQFKYRKCLKKPELKKHHIEARLQFAKKYLQKGRIWKHVIFSDEKKFNLDGPDGLSHYWHDLRKERKILTRRAQGGGSVMIWAAFKQNYKSEIAFIEGRINAMDYQEMLHDNLLPFITLTEDDKVIFQQDNAPIHTAASTKKWFEDFGIELLPWPALSPDLNPIENLWGILARRVYDQGKPPINNIAELRRRIESAWADIPDEILNKLINSVPDRLLEVITNKGKSTKY